MGLYIFGAVHKEHNLCNFEGEKLVVFLNLFMYRELDLKIHIAILINLFGKGFYLLGKTPKTVKGSRQAVQMGD